MQQLTGDYRAAAASHLKAFAIYQDEGQRLGEAEVLNSLGELSTRTRDPVQARDYHTQALRIARDLPAPLEEARALEGIGRSHLYDGNAADGTTLLRDALDIYLRLGTPDASRIQQRLGELAPAEMSDPS